MKKTSIQIRNQLLAAAVAVALTGSSSFGAFVIGTWNSTSSSAWETATNWSTNPIVPGSNDIRDQAIFSGATKQLTVTPDSGRSIGSIQFSGAGNYVIGTTTGNALTLSATDGSGNITSASSSISTVDTVNAPLTLAGAYQFVNTSADATTTLVINGAIGVNTGTGYQIQLKGTNTGNNIVGGGYTAGAGGSILKLGIGTWTMAAASTYGGTTQINAGTLIAGNSTAFGSASSAIVLGSTNANTAANSNPTLLVAGASTNLARNITMGTSANTNANAYTLGGKDGAKFSGAITLGQNLTLQATTGSSVAFSATWTSNNKIFTVGSSGNTGTVQLSSALSTTGGVNVAFGKLQIDNAVTVTAPVTVSSGATLTGAGTVAGTVGVSGTIAPGVGVGTLSTGSETFAGGGAYQWQVDKVDTSTVIQPAGLKGVDPGYDFLNITGTNTLTIGASSASPFVIDVTAAAMPTWQSDKTYIWTLATANSISGFNTNAFSVLTTNFANTMAVGSSFYVSQSTDGKSLLLNYVVPEPASLSLLATAGVLMLGRRRVR